MNGLLTRNCWSSRAVLSTRLSITAALAVVAGTGAAWAQCNCTCDALVPSNQQINQVLMNEGGGGPSFLVSAGSPSGAAREIRHGNLFAGNSMTITHVCIALDSPSGQPGELARIQFYQPDPDPINNGLPGSMYYDQQFQISPGFNGHQIVQLVTPQAATAAFWVVVAYPTAQPAIGHQGTAQRTTGQSSSAVFISGPPDPLAPGWVPNKWAYYDDMGGPGGTTGYFQMAAIIRPLHIVPSSSVCPYGQQCCASVCAIEPNCCINWDPLCEQLAFQLCFQTGCATCPVGGIDENEACSSDLNGGCDTNGIFMPIQCDTTICGTLWRDQLGVTDYDWYVIDVNDNDGNNQSFFIMTVESEAAIEVILQNDYCPLDIPYVIYTGQNVPVCIPKVFGGAVPSPGRYRISVRPIGIAGTCAAPRHYTLSVDVDDCGPIIVPPNNDCANAGPDLTPGTFTYDTTGATTDGPPEPCGFNGLNDADVWMNVIAPCNGTATLSLTSTFDHLLSVWTDCPLTGGVPLGCASGSGPIPAIVMFPTIAGQIYKVRSGGLNGQTGLATLQYDFMSCAADIAPPPFGNCVVGVPDLLAVINSWGPCPPGCPIVPCPADLNNDCLVGVPDLLAIINNWGPCP